MAATIFQCSQCGKSENLSAYVFKKALVKEMRANNLCHGCALLNKLFSSKITGMAVISGGLYTFTQCKKLLNRKYKDTSNYKYLFDLKTRKAIATDNITYLANIPSFLRTKYKDEYKFISFETFRRIINFGGRYCRAKGCYDRYHCFWYNTKRMEKDGPWNQIPESHVIGGEQCISFINKNNMYDLP